MTSTPAATEASPIVVVLGGGRGLSASLRAAKRMSSQVVAVVSVADDGGSSGRLRDTLGIPPPGDLRKSLVALADEASVRARAMEYRFEQGELAGHPVGNVLLAGLFAVTKDLVAALSEAAAMIGSRGAVLPAACEPVTLSASFRDGEVRGQVQVAATPGKKRVSFVPENPAVPQQATQAVARADLVVLGPGSLYTSVIAAAAIPAMREAIARTPALVAYVCNLAEQRNETEGFTVGDHLEALAEHGIRVDVVVVDPEARLERGEVGVPALVARVADQGGTSHDPDLLSGAFARLVAMRREGMRP